MTGSLEMVIERLAHGLLRLPRIGKRLLAMLLDAALCAFTVWIAWCLRVEHWVSFGPPQVWATLGAWLIGLPLFVRFGLYASVFRYAGWNATLAMGKAAAAYGALYALVFSVIGVPDVPRSVGVLQPILMLLALGASRLSVRLLVGDLYRQIHRRSQAPGVLIYGAGKAGMQLAASLLKMDDERLIGYLDDDPALQGRNLDGLTVYAPAKLEELREKQKVSSVLLAIPSAAPQRRKQIMEMLRRHAVHVRTLPGLSELVKRGVHPADLQDVDIEDLLGRDPVSPDPALMDGHLRGKTILVTGAGGSIGSELCRQILRWRPRALLLLERSEYALYEIHRELDAVVRQSGDPVTELVPLIGSVVDRSRVNIVMGTWRPDIVYHAAAYKHVPLVEHNPLEGLRNNVWGTLVCARAAARHGVERFVLVSTDKAVRPTNVMGASKRLSEMVLQALDDAYRRTGSEHSTCFTMVRFGNVLGSSGSVVPLFRRQINEGGPVTVTHRDITRYFMTIPEAAQLVIQAGAMAHGGGVFVLDMGEPVRIYDLACRMIELTGRQVRDAASGGEGIEIRFTGLRPGEKLYEELLIGHNTLPTAHPRIMTAKERFVPWEMLQAELDELARHMHARRHEDVRALLMELVEGYHPTGPVVDWVESAPANLAEAANEALILHMPGARKRGMAAAARPVSMVSTVVASAIA